MYSNRFYSPLRYPGGKAAFADFIAIAMENNGLKGGHYLEPYAGGAGVALKLLFHKHASHIHINDADPAVYAFWMAATKHSMELIDLLERTPITMKEWFRWRSILRAEVGASLVERGFATLFLNRTNRSGILKAGVIGGKAQNGTYKLDARFKKDAIASRIQEISKHSDKISVYCEDSIDILQRCQGFLPKKSLLYLDPPYYMKGQGLYRNFYKHNDHVAIAKVIQAKTFSLPWIVTYDDVEEIRSMYKPSRLLKYGLNYTAQRRYVGSEVMFFSRKLIIPNDKIPCTVAVG